MKIRYFFLLFMLFSPALWATHTAPSNEFDYCYKPSKPLFFSTQEYKNRYSEDMKEYQRCQSGFHEMKAHLAEIKKESDRNARLIMSRF